MSPPGGDRSRARVSRRDFLRKAGVGTVITTAGAVVSFEESTAFAQQRWTREADVVIVGSGAAGAAAALFVHQEGASALIVEKAAIVGGTSAKSLGVHWIPNNFRMRERGVEDTREDCVRYMARLAYPTLYDPDDPRMGLEANEYELLVALYDHGAPAVEALRGMEVGSLADEAPGYEAASGPDYYAELPENKAPQGRSLTGMRRDGTRVSTMQQLKEAVEKRGIPILMEHRVTRLVLNDTREVIGLEATTPDGVVVPIRARRAVIFASGGFTGNAELCVNFLRGPIFGGCAAATNQGDFVHIATAAGAKLANMNNAWWGPVILERALQTRAVEVIFFFPGDSAIQVNAYGRRVTSEKGIYNERTQAHFVWDPHTARYPNAVQFMIYDQFCRDRFGALSGPIPQSRLSAPYVLSGQTLEELAGAIDARLAAIADRTGNFRLGPAFTPNLRETIARFNQFAETGVDLDFHRGESPIEAARHGPRRPGNTKPNPTMYPIAATGPYYAVMIGGGALDTKGGPKVNAKAQVLDTSDRPIPGLYGAGNCIGSPTGQGYFAGGGTIGAALTFAAIAARHAVKEPVKTVPESV